MAFRSEVFAKYRQHSSDEQRPLTPEGQKQQVSPSLDDTRVTYSPAASDMTSLSVAGGAIPLDEYSRISGQHMVSSQTRFRGDHETLTAPPSVSYRSNVGFGAPLPRSEAVVPEAPPQDHELEDMPDWDEVNRSEEQRRRQDQMKESSSGGSSESLPITFKEAYETIRDKQKSSWTPFITSDLKRLSDHAKESSVGLWGLVWRCFHADIEEGTELYSERDFVLALQFVTLDHGNEVHKRMLLTIYRKLMKTPRGTMDPATRGSHWERLGFQGTDPGTDLRSTGILGLLQILYLIDFYPVFCGALFQCVTSPLRECPFVLVCFNFSGFAMESLKERGLHDTIAKLEKSREKSSEASKKLTPSKTVEKSSSGSGSLGIDFTFEPLPVMHAICEFFVGSLWEFFSEWRAVPTRKVTEFGAIKARLRTLVRENVNKTIAKCDIARDRKRVNDITSNKSGVSYMTSSSGGAPANDREFMEF